MMKKNIKIRIWELGRIWNICPWNTMCVSTEFEPNDMFSLEDTIVCLIDTNYRCTAKPRDTKVSCNPSIPTFTWATYSAVHKIAWRLCCDWCCYGCHYNDVIMSAMASQITILTIVYSNVYSGVTGFFAGKSPVTGEFPAQRASNAENASISWRHHYNHLLVDSSNHFTQGCFIFPGLLVHEHWGNRMVAGAIVCLPQSTLKVMDKLDPNCTKPQHNNTMRTVIFRGTHRNWPHYLS